MCVCVCACVCVRACACEGEGDDVSHDCAYSAVAVLDQPVSPIGLTSVFDQCEFDQCGRLTSVFDDKCGCLTSV